MLKRAGSSDRVGNERFQIQLYRNSQEQHHAGFPETKFGPKYVKTCAIKYVP